ncbi:AfsR/SARP family transcriptional regulator [Saccharothrix variisporea]|uniref:DNA-binding SARP family transcriptional activator n=1 Tax=Saccharothrix variisporea TaxID=543527 RepID=A0A495X822_9PSEU|nr:BTAD domain-containing putative transcriptional regulator [Saccharothrix variisporea]RKT69024.1 DNA-binding SARP family transcriptional activator [Saccharothrix variisporea]
MEFRVFGAVEAVADGVRLDLGHARQRSVLAALLVDLDRPVPAERLIDRVWGDKPPLRAEGVLRTYVSRLRRVLGSAIVRRDGGYLLDAEPDDVDLHRFRDLTARARRLDDSGQALELVEQALALCTGDPFAGLGTPWFEAERQAVAAELDAAQAHRVDLALRVGRHTELLAELPLRAAERPWDERLAGQLMLALYRAGRAADALRQYRTTRDALVEHLGTEPGPELRELHRRVLDSDPRLTGSGRRVPQLLPAAPAAFTGRERELAALDVLLDRAPVAVVTGGGGVGKTWLALRWAHGHRDDFPDGRLHVDLRGFDPVAEPLAPDAVVRGFLGALGVPPREVPAEPDAQAALYRDLTADRRLLVVLDNARDTGQVAPLLPGGTSCAVLVTSRHRLTGLVATRGAVPVPVDVLDEPQAADVLARHLGADRVAAEPEAADVLARHGGGLPLALGVLAARAKAAPHVPLAALAEEVREARLDALDTGDLPTSLRAVFSASLRVLGADAVRLFGLLGLVPGPDVGVPAAAALADRPVPLVRRALRELEDAHLVQQHVPGRYRMHDLVRLHARELADDPAALERLCDHYCHVASVAAAMFTPGEPHRRPPVPPLVGPEPEFADHREAARWVDEERACLLAIAVHGQPRHAAHLSRALARYLDTSAQVHDALALHTVAAERTGDGFALTNRGFCLTRLGRPEEALPFLRRAQAVVGDDLALENLVYTQLGITVGGLGRHEEAAEFHARALAAARRGGFRHSVAVAQINCGDQDIRFGRYEQARLRLQESVDIARELGDWGLGAVALSTLGVLHGYLGDKAEADECFEQALKYSSDRVGMLRMGMLFDAAATKHRLYGPEAALPRYREALDFSRRTGYQAEQVRVHTALAGALRELGRAEEAAEHAARAEELRANLR